MVSELDEKWSQMLNEALLAARASGRSDVADYLDLKARNDTVRNASVRWLFEAIVGLAGEAQRESPSISIDREDPHNFSHRGANIAGSLLKIRHGVRCLTIEAGWTRTPADGFMRGGALAIARITHFGMAKMNADLVLKPTDNTPGWTAVYQDGASTSVDEAFLRQHFAVFVSD